MLNLPNLLCLIRIFFAPVTMALLAIDASRFALPALCIMILGELSDIADGQIARRTGQVTELGKLLDPLADSLYRSLVFLGFMAAGFMPFWMMAIFIMRDTIVSYVRIFSALDGIVVSARLSGKLKAVIQGVVQIGVCLLIVLQTRNIQQIAWWGFLMAAVVTAWSGVDYVAGWVKHLVTKENKA